MSTITTERVRLVRSEHVGLIEIDSPPVNASSHDVRRGLLEAVQRIRADDSLRAVVISCAGRTFMAGGDIQEFDAPSIAEPHPNVVFEAIENLGRPVVAALHGTVLGGGLELALACHHRVALSSAVFGMPEVKLGLIPGAGGTQRLPRLAGIPAALDMITRGETLNAERARQAGIIDAVVDGDLMAHAIATATRLAMQGGSPRQTSREPLDAAALRAGFFAQYRNGLPAQERGGRAARAAVRCVESALELPFEEALRLERASFDECKASPESRALRHLFFAEREAARVPGLQRAPEAGGIRSIGVVGAGLMGSGIATCFVQAGLPVTLVDVAPQALERGLAAVKRNLEAAASKGRMTAEQAQRSAALVTGAPSDTALAACDLVIEAAFEDLAVKKALCERLGQLCRPGAVIASNTSTLDIDVLAQACGRPGDFVGMHFFSPAHVMKLLEVVRGAATSPQVLASVMAIAKRIGKTAVVCGVCYGFIGNRMLEPYLRETEFLLLEGALPSQIDQAIEAAGMAMGPCRMIDMAGVDVAARVVLERMKAGAWPDPSYRAVVRRLHALGRHGQKTGRGYYRYEGRAAVEDSEVATLCRELAAEHGVRRRQDITDAEIVERCLYPLMNEGARILEEGIAQRAGDIDLVWVLGYGYPAYRGGPMYSAAALGAPTLVEKLQRCAAQRGNAYGYWSVAESLLRAARGQAEVG